MLFSSNFCETLLVEKASALVLFIEVMHMGFNILIYTKWMEKRETKTAAAVYDLVAG